MQNIAVSITGFSGADLLHVERLISLVGADYYQNLTRRRSLLLTPDIEISGQKMLKAKEWNIPIVRVGWLWQVTSRGGEQVDIAPWCDHPVGMTHPNALMPDLVRYSPEEASSGLKTASGVTATCPPKIVKQSPILDGCVIFVSKKLEALATELNSIAEHLGARVANKFNPDEVTHLIHQSSRATETFREFRQARTFDISIVHPQWLIECRSRGARCAEDAWGWMWNADKNLAIFEAPERHSAPPEVKREKRVRQDENTPPERNGNPAEPVKMEQLTKLLGTVSSPQKKTRRKLAGRARNTQVSTGTSSVQSPEDVFTSKEDEDGPRPTQERVEYKDPIAEREMARIIANLQGVAEDEKVAQFNSNGMTPAEDIGKRGGRRKSARK
jgi:BRCA1 C Terminus (BRCT) domain/twin BRCT domain